jgi:hypothetical protein
VGCGATRGGGIDGKRSVRNMETKNKFKMSVSIYDFFANDEEIALEKEWLFIRDMLLGQNHVDGSLRECFAFIRSCKHVEAQYLANLFPLDAVINIQTVRLTFLKQPKNDARALYYLGRFRARPSDRVYLENSADLGYVPARSELFRVYRWQNSKYVESFCKARDRQSFFNMGHIEKDKIKADAYFLIAAQLGLVDAMLRLAANFKLHDYRKWIWLGEAVRHNSTDMFLKIAFSQTYYGACLFQIGKTLHNDINYIPIEHELAAQKAIDFYKNQLVCYRAAVDAWTIVALRNRVCKDMRYMTGLLIWTNRYEAQYNAEPVDMSVQQVVPQEEENEWK